MKDLKKNKIEFFFSRIFHKRLRPKIHEFKYKNFYISIPVRTYSLNQDKGNFFFGLNRNSFVSVNNKDHGDGSPLIAWIEKILLQYKINNADGEIWLSTFPKILGIGFKPVSFWFCENKKKQTVAVIVEVNNTFKQREIYVLSPPDERDFLVNGQTLTSKKIFFVSPFIEINGTYKFRFFRNTLSCNETSRIELIDEQGPLIVTAISSEKVRTSSSFFPILMVYYVFLPLLTAARINWQAFKLWLKGIKLITRKA